MGAPAGLEFVYKKVNNHLGRQTGARCKALLQGKGYFDVRVDMDRQQ